MQRSEVDIRPATVADIPAIAPRLREHDVIEARTMTGMDPGDAIEAQMIRSPLAWIAEDSEGPVTMWGAHRADPSSPFVYPWMVTTDRFETYPALRISRTVKRTLPLIVGDAKYATGWVLQDNAVAIAFLRHLGFNVDGEREIRGARFHRFIRRLR